MGHEAVVESLGLEPLESLPEQGDIVREIIGPDPQGNLNLQFPNVLRAIIAGAATGASRYMRTRAKDMNEPDSEGKK